MTDVSAGAVRPKIPVWRTAYDAYRLGFGAVFSSGPMFRFFVYGSALSILVLGTEIYLTVWSAQNLSDTSGPAAIAGYDIVGILIPLLGYIAMAAVQTPLGIAIQRRILLNDEPNVSYLTYGSDHRGRTFFVISLVICAIFYIASMAELPVVFLVYGDPFPLLDATNDEVYLSFALIVTLTLVLASVAACVAASKFAFTFPAIASDRSAAWRILFNETRGTVSRLFFVFLVTFIPLGIVAFVVLGIATATAMSPLLESLMIGDGVSDAAVAQIMTDMESSPPFIVAYAICAFLYMLGFLTMAAAAARAYQIRGERRLSGVAEVFS